MDSEIREKAYSFYEYRMHFDIEGTAEDDWFDAVREVKARHGLTEFKEKYRGGY